MSEEKPLREQLDWGGVVRKHVPDNALAAWSARAIYTPSNHDEPFEFVYGRQDIVSLNEGYENGIKRLLNHEYANEHRWPGVIDQLRRCIGERGLAGDSEDVITIGTGGDTGVYCFSNDDHDFTHPDQDKFFDSEMEQTTVNWTLKATPNGSFGYLYCVAWIEPFEFHDVRDAKPMEG